MKIAAIIGAIVIGIILNIIPFVADYQEPPISFQVPYLSGTGDPDEPGSCGVEDGYRYNGFPFMAQMDEKICNGMRTVYPIGSLLNGLVAIAFAVSLVKVISKLRRQIS